MAPDYLFVDERVIGKFIPQMIECIKKFWGEKPDGSDSQGKIINEIHVKRLTKLIDSAGGKLMYGGKVNESKKHIQPTIILNPN